ncbi:hypothetical protein ACHAQA_008203 [Verticillium albo-atrum]
MAANESHTGHLIVDASRCLIQCLRQIRDAAPAITPTLAKSIPPMHIEKSSCKVHALQAAQVVGHTFWVVIICLLSQLLIWCLSLGLRHMGLPFLSAIVGMVLVFAFMATLNKFCSSTESFYTKRIKPKVDFINKNLGVGFPVPIVAISREDSLGAKGIGRICGNFFTTSIVFWIIVFFLAWGVVAGFLRLPRRSSASSLLGRLSTSTDGEKPQWSSDRVSGQPPRLELPAHTFGRGHRPSDLTALRNSMLEYTADNEADLEHEPRAPSNCSPRCRCLTPLAEPMTRRASHQPDCEAEQHELQVYQQWHDSLGSAFSVMLSAFFIVVVGIPVSYATNDHRILDGCMMWFIWVSAGKIQALLACPKFLHKTSRILRFLVRIIRAASNPVLVTIVLMVAYTRALADATGTPLSELMAAFNSGTTISDLCSHAVGQYTLKKHQRNDFGAGDAALAILECGIVVWGFKLYECRAQLASRTGLAVVLVSAASAALNVFGSTLLGRAVQLAAPEALAFAARCTTLALARPAMEALGGNQVTNAALVVFNGIVGQILYPYALKRLGVHQRGPGDKAAESDANKTDDARTIAAGTAIGINGVAMGVSYLYQQKSRAAPYAVLSMTAFGVMTVVFTAVQPFTRILKDLAG